MNTGLEYFRKHSQPICFLLLLYCGLAVIFYYDLTYRKTPFEYAREVLRTEREMIEDDFGTFKPS